MTSRSPTRRVLTHLDAWMNRLYGWRWNPLYQSGTLVVALLAVLLVTGIYLLLFYRLGLPYASVVRITDQVWVGRWIRGLHRFASDAAVVAAAIHALRLLIQKRSWGPRTLAWVAGLILLFLIFVCGWTGYVMVWDIQGEVLAREGARLLDAIPIFSEPISRTFVGERPIPGAFFFLNLFVHVALPIGLGVLLWIHVSRVARPALLPPRGLMWGAIGLLFLISVVWPIGMSPPADLFRTPGRAEFDWFYAFWLPVVKAVPVWAAWAGGGAVSLALLLTPIWSRPRATARPAPSFVDAQLCTGCEQCYQDCPYEAISMIARPGRAGAAPESDLAAKSEFVAHVDPSLCVSCGICAGSCAPMGVGPPGRTGRDQLSGARAFAAEWNGKAPAVVIAGCTRSAGAAHGRPMFDGVPVLPVNCAGNLHTSVIEYLLRSGAGGVLVVSCPPRDCWNREGPKWLEQRMHHDREAELQERVDRRRVRLVHVAEGQPELVASALAQFRSEIEALERAAAEAAIDVMHECEPPVTAEEVP